MGRGGGMGGQDDEYLINRLTGNGLNDVREVADR